MTLLLNEKTAMRGDRPAAIQVFTDSGSCAHFLLGFLAGSELFAPKDSVILLTGFAGYQLSQAQYGVPWGRTGGELIEFALGMLLGRFAGNLVSFLGNSI